MRNRFEQQLDAPFGSEAAELLACPQCLFSSIHHCGTEILSRRRLPTRPFAASSDHTSPPFWLAREGLSFSLAQAHAFLDGVEKKKIKTEPGSRPREEEEIEAMKYKKHGSAWPRTFSCLEQQSWPVSSAGWLGLQADASRLSSVEGQSHSPPSKSQGPIHFLDTDFETSISAQRFRLHRSDIFASPSRPIFLYSPRWDSDFGCPPTTARSPFRKRRRSVA